MLKADGKYIFYVVIVLLMFLTACQQGTPTSNSSQDMSTWIDASIEGEERNVIAQALELLPEQHRDNVIYIAPDKTIYTNRFSLKKVIPARLDDASPSAFYLADSLPTRGVFSPLSIAACAGGTGPYRRVYTKVGVAPGGVASQGSYAYARASIALPGASQVNPAIHRVGDNDFYRDTPHVYMGGWGSGGASPIDAGFIYNEEEHDKPAAEVAYSWTLFLRGGGNDKAVDFNLRTAAGTTATLEFYVPQNDMVAVRADGQFARPGAAGSQSGVTMLDGGATGWRQNGAGNILKRVTSIAQRPKSEAFDTGASVSTVAWSNLVVGGSAGAIAAWEMGQTEPNGGVCNYPNSTVVTALDLFQEPLGNTASSYEEVTINLQ